MRAAQQINEMSGDQSDQRIGLNDSQMMVRGLMWMWPACHVDRQEQHTPA
jgi:hypothetical protein